MTDYNTLANTNNFIVLDKYTKKLQVNENYQTEYDLERELIKDLTEQGYEYLSYIKDHSALLLNLRQQLQTLNKIEFTDAEWERFLTEYLDKASDGILDKTYKIHKDYIYDFVFDDGHIKNIYLFDKETFSRNKVQVIRQFEQTGTQTNRYDVTILINGLPLVQIELKKRGVAIREAFNQIHRYSKESFNTENSLFKFLQIFIISNGTDTRYFANTIKRGKNTFDFTMNWAKSDNSAIKDLKDFTVTFLQKETLLEIILRYSIFDVDNNLLIMRPYQIAATERILWKIKSSFYNKNWSKVESGGYIWHTTGSGKTLTSYKAAQLATELAFIDKVFFVVDRKDLDYQTIKEYQRFSPDSVNGSENTAGLKRNIEKNDNKIIVTTIQKLNNLVKSENQLEIYNKQVVFIFDECHRSQFGEAQRNITRKFKKYYQFGFTGTPIFSENALGDRTTDSVFGLSLHKYVITDAIRDEKVLKFKVDYNNVQPQFKDIETEKDERKLTAAENKLAFLHPNRIGEISQYILDNFSQKTHRTFNNGMGFNAMFAVSSIDAAKAYYEKFKELQEDNNNPLKVATIFSFAANEPQEAIGNIVDESFDISAMNSSAKEFLNLAIADYNSLFKTNFGVDSKSFQNYYRDLAQKVRNREIDLLIVVGMFLTGFDAPTLNTLFVDKNLRYHGLIQAFSRTNRIYGTTKSFGNIVTFRDLEQATIDAITLFGNKDTSNIVLEKSYQEYMNGFNDIISSATNRGFINIIQTLQERFPEPREIYTEQDRKEFVKLFGEYLITENILQNYDEFISLKAIQDLDLNNPQAVEEFQQKYHLDDEQFNSLKLIKLPSERIIQDYRSVYNDTRDWLRKEKQNKQQMTLDWDNVVFEVELLKSQEINLDYILSLIFDQNAKNKNKENLIEEISRLTRSNINNRAKEDLLIDFINQTNLDEISDKANLIDRFFEFAQNEQQREADELIQTENLNSEKAKRYINTALKRGYATENGTELNETLPKMSPLNPQYKTKKQTVFQKIVNFVDKFRGIGGRI